MISDPGEPGSSSKDTIETSERSTSESTSTQYTTFHERIYGYPVSLIMIHLWRSPIILLVRLTNDINVHLQQISFRAYS